MQSWSADNLRNRFGETLLKALTHKRKTTSMAKLPHSARIKTGLRPLRSEKAPQNPVVNDDRMPISRLRRRAW